MMTVAPWPRAMKLTAVAQPSAASVKNCQGWRLVEVAELIVDALVERGIDRRGRAVGRGGLARPLHGGKRDGDRARGADQVREEPRHPVEAAVERRTEHLFRAVLRQKRLDDLVVVLALVDERGELAAHLVRGAAVVLAALGKGLVPARAAGADDL